MKNIYVFLLSILLSVVSQYVVTSLSDISRGSLLVSAAEVSSEPLTSQIVSAAQTSAADSTPAEATETAAPSATATGAVETVASTDTDPEDYLSLTNSTTSASCISSVTTYSFLLYSPNISYRFQYLNNEMNITWGYSNKKASVSSVQIYYKAQSAPQTSWKLAANASGSTRTVMWLVKDIGADYYLLKLIANGKDNTVAGSTVCYAENEVQTGITASPIYIFPEPALQVGTTPYMPNSSSKNAIGRLLVMMAAVLLFVTINL